MELQKNLDTPACPFAGKRRVCRSPSHIQQDKTTDYTNHLCGEQYYLQYSPYVYYK